MAGSRANLPTHEIEGLLRTLLIGRRKRGGFTQEALAAAMNYQNASAIGQVECGVRPTTLRYFLHACDAMGVDPCELMEKACAQWRLVNAGGGERDAAAGGRP